MQDTIQQLLADPAYEPSALVPWREILPEYRCLNDSKMRYIIAQRATNGAEACGALVLIGAQMCVNKPRFRIWLADSQRRAGELEHLRSTA
jgi:hypothetical protein